jgi:hypothetical protein
MCQVNLQKNTKYLLNISSRYRRGAHCACCNAHTTPQAMTSCCHYHHRMQGTGTGVQHYIVAQDAGELKNQEQKLEELQSRIDEEKIVGILAAGCTCQDGQHYTFANITSIEEISGVGLALRLACGTFIHLSSSLDWFIPGPETLSITD